MNIVIQANGNQIKYINVKMNYELWKILEEN